MHGNWKGSSTNCFLRKLRSSTCSSMLARQINQLLPPANSDAPYLLPPSLPYLRPPVHSYPPPLVVPFHLNSYNLARKPCSRHPTQSVTSPKEKAKVLDPQLHFHLHKSTKPSKILNLGNYEQRYIQLKHDQLVVRLVDTQCHLSWI